MARRECHAGDVGYVPGAHDDAARLWIVLYGLDHLLDLVDVTAVVVGPRPPLVAVDVAEISVGASPFIPYPHSVVLKILHIGVPFQEPEEFVDDGFEMEFLGGEEGESFAQVKPHLMAKHTACACARAVATVHSLGHYSVEQVEILSHSVYLVIFVSVFGCPTSFLPGCQSIGCIRCSLRVCIGGCWA